MQPWEAVQQWNPQTVTGIRCKLLRMGSRRVLRLRLAITLALVAMMGSDAALAALVCSRGTGCHSASSRQGQPVLSAEDTSNTASSEMGPMPCCPGGSAEVTMECSNLAMGCCTLQQGGSQPAVVISKFSPGPSGADAAVSAIAAPFVRHAAEQFHYDWGSTASPYIRPVDQKKTDLRI
jgi:hypothetical protein